MSPTGYAVVYLAVELLWYLLLRLMSRSWRRPLSVLEGDFPKAMRTPAEILKKVEFHMSRSLKDAEAFLTDWHFGAAMSTLRRHDVEDFLCWATFTRRRHQV